MTEYEKAKAWREKRGLNIKQLAHLTGYGERALYWLERGQSPPNALRDKPAKVAPWIWQRYKMMAAGVEAQLASGKKFEW